MPHMCHSCGRIQTVTHWFRKPFPPMCSGLCDLSPRCAPVYATKVPRDHDQFLLKDFRFLTRLLGNLGGSVRSLESHLVKLGWNLKQGRRTWSGGAELGAKRQNQTSWEENRKSHGHLVASAGIFQLLPLLSSLK